MKSIRVKGEQTQNSRRANVVHIEHTCIVCMIKNTPQPKLKLQ